ncbi:LysR family transcriptional regulator [Tropicimonas sp. TH_r6]|uniref:LysR family transcriptional regulator n=1 Tax=Tropicimonas sp. TH_r6 TaxID=3082085 RepID=UPI00295426F7|nr:LysR family transcriptional regulator [Tropicimonas sp. TH_r6]MDV7145619.1 LysR family transcriptional regulator [Tropicimonas sp. TH_r6]
MRLSDVDLRLLRVFKAVAESGGIVKAQGVLGISQPTISSHIANLEKRLNARLCERGPQGFSLTFAGQEVLQETERMLTYLDGYVARLDEIGKSGEQVVRVGLIDCMATDPNCPLQRAIRKASQKVKGLKLRLGIHDFLDCQTELRSGQLDLAIMGFDESVPTDIEAIRLYDEASSLYCSPDHPCASAGSWEEALNILKESEISAQSFAQDPIGMDLDPALLSDTTSSALWHIEATAHLVLAGTHVGLMPVHYAAHWVDRGQMVMVSPECWQVTSNIHLVRMKGQDLSPAAQCLCDELIEGCAADA